MTPQRAEGPSGQLGWLVTDKHVFLTLAVVSLLFVFRDRIMGAGREEAQTAIALEALTVTVRELKTEFADYTRQTNAQRSQDGDRISRAEADLRGHLNESRLIADGYTRGISALETRVDRLEGRRTSSSASGGSNGR